MDLMGIILGVVFIALGILVKKYPNLIAGYNLMTPEQKMNVDELGLATWARKSFVGTGVVLIVANLLEAFVIKSDIFGMVYIAITVLGVVVMVVGAQRFDRN